MIEVIWGCRQAATQHQSWPQHVSYLHALGEGTDLPPKSFDVINAAYIMHECPTHAIQSLVQEAQRLLRPGGILAITDNDPE